MTTLSEEETPTRKERFIVKSFIRKNKFYYEKNSSLGEKTIV